MEYFSHPLIQFRALEAREYQVNIAKIAAEKNTLCVLPTGLGKTAIAIMVAAERMEKFPESKVLIVAPTRPLAEQHQKSFRNIMDVPKKEIILMTGRIPPRIRGAYYRNGRIICATPQTIRNDLINGSLGLRDFSLLIVDEVHRAVKKYAYPFVARKYLKEAEHPRVLGLTASPGSNQAKIKEVCKNLGIEHVEIRTEIDKDVREYVHETDIEVEKVWLGEKLKAAQENLRLALKESEKLKALRIKVHNKRELIEAQQKVQKRLEVEKNPILFHQVSTIAETIKLWYILELLETQSLASVLKYFEGMGDSRAAKRIKRDLRVRLALEAIKKEKENGKEHPKIIRLCERIKEEVKRDVNIIVFSHYRSNIEEIYKRLKRIEKCKPVILIGQAGAGGLSQKEQIEIIKDYESGIYNCLITSPIGEEGLHLASADVAFFYEPVASEIRTIQRRGRVGRTKLGRIVVLITGDTRDEANFYIARRKERKMKKILSNMQENNLTRFV